MTPIVNGLENDYGDRIIFQHLNAALEGRALFQRYNVRGHPAYVILDEQGNVIWRLAGQVPREALEQGIERALER
jgi:thioredoxin-related protein